MDGCKPPQKSIFLVGLSRCFHGVLVELFFCSARASAVITGEGKLSPPHIPFLLAASLSVEVYVFIRAKIQDATVIASSVAKTEAAFANLEGRKKAKQYTHAMDKKKLDEDQKAFSSKS